MQFSTFYSYFIKIWKNTLLIDCFSVPWLFKFSSSQVSAVERVNKSSVNYCGITLLFAELAEVEKLQGNNTWMFGRMLFADVMAPELRFPRRPWRYQGKLSWRYQLVWPIWACTGLCLIQVTSALTFLYYKGRSLLTRVHRHGNLCCRHNLLQIGDQLMWNHCLLTN